MDALERIRELSTEVADDRRKIASLEAINAELLEALKEPCQYHHLPLINGWAHSIHIGTGEIMKTIRCPLSEKARTAIKKAEAK